MLSSVVMRMRIHYTFIDRNFTIFANKFKQCYALWCTKLPVIVLSSLRAILYSPQTEGTAPVTCHCPASPSQIVSAQILADRQSAGEILRAPR